MVNLAAPRGAEAVFEDVTEVLEGELSGTALIIPLKERTNHSILKSVYGISPLAQQSRRSGAVAYGSEGLIGRVPTRG